MTTNMPPVAILILNWNGADDTIACLRSLEKITYPNAQTFLIDNASQEGRLDEISSLFPDISLIQNDSNLFYGGGNNAGFNAIEPGKFKYSVFLNNDVEVESRFLEPLISELEMNQNTGAVAPVILYHGSNTIWYKGGDVNFWTGHISHPHIRKPFLGTTPQISQTDYITGCCLVIREPLFRALNGFDEHFQMYGEDVDLSLRIREKNFDLKVVQNSIIYHKVSASIGGAFAWKKLKKKFSGMMILFRHRLKWYQWITLFLSQIFRIPFYIFTYLKEK
jgi:GT2 family glycosyltransferase